MRYILLGLGLSAFAIGLFSDWRMPGALWLIVGAILFGFGLATIDVVAAIRTQADEGSDRERLEHFHAAARTGDAQKMAQLLQSGGVPEDVARRAAERVLQDQEVRAL